jgi:hypothetical protein
LTISRNIATLSALRVQMASSVQGSLSTAGDVLVTGYMCLLSSAFVGLTHSNINLSFFGGDLSAKTSSLLEMKFPFRDLSESTAVCMWARRLHSGAH